MATKIADDYEAIAAAWRALEQDAVEAQLQRADEPAADSSSAIASRHDVENIEL